MVVLIIKGSLAFGVLNGARFLLFRTKFQAELDNFSDDEQL